MTGDPPKSDYAIIPNDLIDDASLSSLARLLGIWLRSRPKGWTTNETAMCQAMGVKDPKTVRKALHELYEAGWAKLDVRRGEEGRIFQYVYSVRRAGKFRVRKPIGGIDPPVTTGSIPGSTQVSNRECEKPPSHIAGAVVIQGPWSDPWAHSG